MSIQIKEFVGEGSLINVEEVKKYNEDLKKKAKKFNSKKKGAKKN